MTERQETAENGSIVIQVLAQLSGLLRKEVELARAETAEKIAQAGIAIALLVFAAITTLVGLNVLAAAIVAGISEGLDISEGWSAVIFSFAALLLATGFGLKGLHRLKPENLLPERTGENIRKDAELLKEKIHG